MATKDRIKRATLGAGGGPGGGGGADPPLGGDLSGTASAATVERIKNVQISGAPSVSNDTLRFNPITAQLEWGAGVLYFATGAAAAAGAPHLLNQSVVIYPGTTPAEAGTYKVTANDGSAFPGDYTKVSDSTDTAAELGVVDAADHFNSPDAEGVLAEIGGGAIRGVKGTLSIGANVIDSVLHASYPAGEWVILLKKGSLVYKTCLSISHDGGIASVVEHSAVPGTGITVMPVTFDADILVSALRVIATATETGWSYHIRRTAMMEA